MPDQIESAPTVFGSLPLPRRTPVLQLTFRFERSDIVLSTALFDHLKLQPSKQLVFIECLGVWYVSRADSDGLTCSVRSREGQVHSVTIHHRPFCEQLRQRWGYAPDEVRQFLVSNHPYVVPGLDMLLYPYPVYRLIDQTPPL